MKITVSLRGRAGVFRRNLAGPHGGAVYGIGGVLRASGCEFAGKISAFGGACASPNLGKMEKSSADWAVRVS